MVDRLAYLSTVTVGTTTMLGPTCQGSCKHPSSSVTWPASATVSS